MSRRLLSAITFGVFLLFIGYSIFTPSPVKQKARFDTSTSKGLNAYLLEQKKLSKSRPRFDKPDKAMQEEVAIRSEVNKPFAYKGSWRFRAFKQARQNRIFSLQKTSALNWVERGPANFGGRTRSVIVHPNNDDIWWAGAVGGGIWKTTDAGLSWTCKSDNMPVISVCAMDICRNQPDVLYAGTGEGFYNGDAVIGDGIFKSTDGGESWQQLASTASNSNFRYVNRIIVDPDDPDILLAATNSGLYRSTDGGANWTETFHLVANDRVLRVQQIIANPLRFETQFITVNGRNDTGTYPGGIYKSTDGGQNWRRVSEEIVDHGRIEMAIAEVDTNILYASPVNSDYGLLGFFRSADAGETWVNYGNSTNWLSGQGWYDNALVVSPLSPDIIIVGGLDIYRVHISGASMSTTKLTNWYTGTEYPYVHADQHALVTIQTSQNNFSVIAGNDGGVHFSDDAGSNWDERNTGYNVTQYYDADRHPSTNEFIGGTQDNGTHRSPQNATAASAWDRVIGGDGFDCAWDKASPSVVYGTLYYTKIYKSTDGGYNFSYSNNGMPESDLFHTPLAMDPANSNKLFTAGNDNTVYWTDDAAANWHSVSISNNSYTRCKIAVSLNNSDVVWAGATTIYINVSTDGGLTFSQATQPEGSPHSWLTGISTHPTDDATAFLTIGSSGSGKIYRTQDLGSSWEDITNNLPDVPVHTVLVMPFDTNEIWIGTDIGLFISYDEGQTWQINNEIPAVSIRRLKIVGQEIVAATHGRGIWSVHRDELAQGELLAPTLYDLTVPNPNTHNLKIRFAANSSYDSVLVYADNQVVDRLYNISAGVDTFGNYLTGPPQEVTAKVEGYRQTQFKTSEEKSRTIYEAVQTINDNFEGSSTFFGDMSIATPSGFNDALLNSDHPYLDGSTVISYLGAPITIKTGSVLSYNDVAVVEPGESGSVYGDNNFWDYVTVEASDDGDNWTILITPYDCRYDPAWQSAYDGGNDGNESMLRYHSVDLTAFFALDENIYIRYRLYADANTHGWGWGVDDVDVTNTVSAIAGGEQPVKEFKLFANYPNPFNPATVISWQLAVSGHVELAVFNTLGQKVRTLVNEEKVAGTHSVSFDATGLASGSYFYRLVSGGKTQIRKMLLMR